MGAYLSQPVKDKVGGGCRRARDPGREVGGGVRSPGGLGGLGGGEIGWSRELIKGRWKVWFCGDG